MSDQAFNVLRDILTHTVLHVRTLNNSTFVVRFSRNNVIFSAGQHICVGPHSDVNMREYSIYSSLKEDFLEILVKEIPEGLVSPQLKKIKTKNTIKIEGPFGFFTLEKSDFMKNIYFIATGTGIAPFHCFALSYPHITFNILHGVKTIDQCYDHEVFFMPHSACKYTACVSGNNANLLHPVTHVLSKPKIKNPYFGRVTKYLKNQKNIDKDGIYLLCGNCDMIYEVFDILQTVGVPAEQIKAEVYF